MKHKIIVLCGTALLSIGGLAYLRYKRRQQGWTVLEKVLLTVGVTTVVATFILSTKDYQKAKRALKAPGETIDNVKIIEYLKMNTFPTLGDISRPLGISPQRAKHLIKKAEIKHFGEVIRKGYNGGWYYCKVYDPEMASRIASLITKV